jgi:hypothetical protein
VNENSLSRAEITISKTYTKFSAAYQGRLQGQDWGRLLGHPIEVSEDTSTLGLGGEG